MLFLTVCIALYCVIAQTYAGIESNKDIGRQPQGKCLVDGYEIPIGGTWQQDFNGHIQNCTCRVPLKSLDLPPKGFCEYTKGCVDSLTGQYFDEGTESHDCKCINDYDPKNPDFGVHFHWRCKHEQNYCNDFVEGRAYLLNVKWTETKINGVNQSCECKHLPRYRRPYQNAVKVCVNTDGCDLPYSSGGRTLFRGGEVHNDRMCIYEVNPVADYLGMHYHWVRNLASGIKPAPEYIVNPLSGHRVGQ